MSISETCRNYKKAADKGDTDAMFHYGRMLYNGDGVSMNKSEACRYCWALPHHSTMKKMLLRRGHRPGGHSPFEAPST